MIFDKPVLLNGETLIKELFTLGIVISSVFVNENEKLELNISEKDKTKVEAALLVHDGSDIVNPKIALRASALAKLAALGLTPDEVASL
jgi:hypothetical protein